MTPLSPYRPKSKRCCYSLLLVSFFCLQLLVLPVQAASVLGVITGATLYSSQEFTQISGVTNGGVVSTNSVRAEVLKTSEKLDDRAQTLFNYALNLGFFLRTPAKFIIPLQYKFIWLYMPGLFEANQTTSIQINHQIQTQFSLTSSLGITLGYVLQTDFLFQSQDDQYISFDGSLDGNYPALGSMVASFFSGLSAGMYWDLGGEAANWRIGVDAQIYNMLNKPVLRFALMLAYLF